jgi:hypothetical protein
LRLVPSGRRFLYGATIGDKKPCDQPFMKPDANRKTLLWDEDMEALRFTKTAMSKMVKRWNSSITYSSQLIGEIETTKNTSNSSRFILQNILMFDEYRFGSCTAN